MPELCVTCERNDWLDITTLGSNTRVYLCRNCSTIVYEHTPQAPQVIPPPSYRDIISLDMSVNLVVVQVDDYLLINDLNYHIIRIDHNVAEGYQRVTLERCEPVYSWHWTDANNWSVGGGVAVHSDPEMIMKDLTKPKHKPNKWEHKRKIYIGEEW